MNKLLVLTVDCVDTAPDPQITVVRATGEVACYHYVDTIDRLAHYRPEAFPEDQAREFVV